MTYITAFQDADPIAGGDLYPVVQTGTNRKATHTQLMAAILALLGDNDPTLAANSALLFATQQAVRAYVNANSSGLSWKASVRAGTTAAGTLATSFENGDTVDGVVLATNDRLLIKDQAAGEENGIYVVAASGAPTRAIDADTAAELLQASLYVREGTANADKQFVLTNDTITLGTTALVFTQLSTGGGLTHWTESVDTAVPNGTVPVTRFLATNAATNVDAAISPKGTGALLGQIPDNGIPAGNKRGQRAVDWQLVRSSADEVASGAESAIGGGYGNKASGTYSTVAGGQANFAIGYASYVPGGTNCTADADYSSAQGYQSGVRGEYGAHAIASGIISGNLDSIVRHRVQRTSTANSTPKVITSNGTAATTTNTIVVANYCAMKIHAEIIGRDGTGGDAKGWTLDAVVSKTGGAGSAGLIGAVGVVVTGGSAGLAAATVTAAVSGGGDNFEISVTGIAANMQWTAWVTTTETVY